MYKVYYNQDNISSEITKFFTSVFPNIRKTHLNILPPFRLKLSNLV